jgi:dihydroorotase
VLTRRTFARSLLASGAAFLNSGAIWDSPLDSSGSDQDSKRYCDLLVKGGTVIDPGQGLHALMDVAVKDGKILEVSRDFPASRALKVVPAEGKIVTPGFIDLHVHCFDGFGGVNADHSCLSRGVTTVVDAGSTGYLEIGGFIKYVVKSSATRVYPLLSIDALGLLLALGRDEATSPAIDSSPGFMNVMDNPDWVYPQITARAAQQHRPEIVGIKVRLGTSIQGTRDLENLKVATDVAEVSDLPLMVHIDNPYSPLPSILKMMRKGDVFTHIFNNHNHGILDANGTILPEVRDARDRGVIFDPAQGQAHFSFDIAEKAMQQGFLPDTISTDLTPKAAANNVFDLPTMVSKFLAIGMDLDKAIELVTTRPANVFDLGVKIGALVSGYEADISVFELQDGKFVFEDSDGSKRIGRQMLLNRSVICRGQLFANSV